MPSGTSEPRSELDSNTTDITKAASAVGLKRMSLSLPSLSSSGPPRRILVKRDKLPHMRGQAFCTELSTNFGVSVEISDGSAILHSQRSLSPERISADASETNHMWLGTRPQRA